MDKKHCLSHSAKGKANVLLISELETYTLQEMVLI
jgi:hypothetical protein